MLIIKGISQDIRNALELSNAPSADNLFATMDDIDTLAEEGNKKLSSCMSLVLTRLTSHTSNTFASPIALQSFDIHIQKDGFGSSEELIK